MLSRVATYLPSATLGECAWAPARRTAAVRGAAAGSTRAEPRHDGTDLAPQAVVDHSSCAGTGRPRAAAGGRGNTRRTTVVSAVLTRAAVLASLARVRAPRRCIPVGGALARALLWRIRAERTGIPRVGRQVARSRYPTSSKLLGGAPAYHQDHRRPDATVLSGHPRHLVLLP